MHYLLLLCRWQLKVSGCNTGCKIAKAEVSLLGLFELPWSLFRGPESSVIQGEQDDCLQRCAGRLWPGTTYIAPGLNKYFLIFI